MSKITQSGTHKVAAAMHQDALNPADAEHSQQNSDQTADHHKPNDHETLAGGTLVCHSQKIFDKDVVPQVVKYALPGMGESITNTPQLVYCLSLLHSSSVSKKGLSETEYEWTQAVADNPNEHERLQSMATDLIRVFIRDKLKNPDVVAEIVCLTVVLDRNDVRKLLQAFVNDIEQSASLNLNSLDGLAHVIRNATPGYIDALDLTKVLELLSMRLKGLHQQSIQDICRLAQAVSCVLDSMADSQILDLKREQVHEFLSEYMKELKESSHPTLVYHAAYTFQALQYIPDNESILRTMIRHTGETIQGNSGVASAAKALNFDGFIKGIITIQVGLIDSGKAVKSSSDPRQNEMDQPESLQDLLECLKRGFSFSRKNAWYPALRGLDVLLQQGQFIDFEKLIRETPCRKETAFQLGVCQRLRNLAANALWDDDIRRRSVTLLGELYKDDTTWGHQTINKQWILYIIVELAYLFDIANTAHAFKFVVELETISNAMKRSLLQLDHACSYLSTKPLACQTFPLLDRVKGKPDVESTLIQLRRERLSERDGDLFFSPRAKDNHNDTEDFDLTSKVQEFISSDKKVFLLLRDPDDDMFTFNRALETNLWDGDESLSGKIPLFIHLPAIDNPEQDMIAKQLQSVNFTAGEIRELKANREFILICNGYDESLQTRNLYMSNQFNQIGGWRAQMVVSCCTEYNGVDYKNRFQPTDRNDEKKLDIFQEAVIVGFNKDQIQGYIDQYVSASKPPPCRSGDYIQAFEQIHGLQDLVQGPFVQKLALELLPTLIDIPGNFSKSRISLIELYDKFFAQWLERSEKRLVKMDLSFQEKENFKRLSESGFKRHCTTYLKQLATAIYNNQDGDPVVKYSEHRDRGTWKEPFFSKMNGSNLLAKAIPLIRNGDQYRFIHKSVLEYGLALAVFDPSVQEENTEPTLAPSRRGSTSSVLSFELPPLKEETAVAHDRHLVESPLSKRTFVDEPSILQFLVERAQQRPVFKDQLQGIIQMSKTDKTVRITAVNAMTVLVKASVQFNGADLRGIKIPGADLSHGVFDSAQLEGADLRKANLRYVWLRQANLSRAQMGGVQFGELPPFQEGSPPGIRRYSPCTYSPCAYSPIGKTCAIGSKNGAIYVYDTTNWSRMQILRGHSNEVTSLVYSPNGDRITSGSHDKTVRLWNVETGCCIHTLLGHDDTITCVVYSPKVDQIATGSTDQTVRLWNIETGKCVHTFRGHGNTVWNVAYSPQEDEIISVSDRIVRLWDIRTGASVRTFQGHDDTVKAIAYSSRGDLIVTGCWDNTLRLWNVETGDCIQTFKGHNKNVGSVVFSPKEDQIASGGGDNTIRLWDIRTGNCLHNLQGHSKVVGIVAYSPKGDIIASGSLDKTVRVWSIETGQCLVTIAGFGGSVTNLAWEITTDGQYLVTGSRENSVRRWQIIRERDGYKALLNWSSPHGALTVVDGTFRDVHGLSRSNVELLHQHNALISTSE